MIQILNHLKQHSFVTLVVTMMLHALMLQPLYAKPLQATESLDAASIQLIQFEAGISEAEAREIVAGVGYELIEWLAPLHIAKVQPSNAQVRSAQVQAATLSESAAEIKFIESAGRVYGTGQDPALADAFQSYGLRNIYAEEGWAKESGSPTVVIAVIDTGLDMDNVEFAGRMAAGYDFVNYDNDPDDDHGHGTHVSGIATAAHNNDVGSAGVCGGCKIMPIKVLDEDNSGDWFAVAQGIVYATNSGADIINLSLGSSQPSHTVGQAILYAQAEGVLIVAAAGNAASTQPFYPAAYEGVIAVSATKTNNTLWSLSNHGDYITVAAPGENIYSTALNNGSGNSITTLGVRSGTSMASPYVAGLAGLLLSQNPERTAENLHEIIVETATDLGDSGYDEKFGHGLINVLTALDYQIASGNIQGVGNSISATVYLPFCTQ